MKSCRYCFATLLLLYALQCIPCSAREYRIDSQRLFDVPDHSHVPGIVIAHSPASSGRYIGSPSIAILPNGNYVASHDYFGPKATHTKSPSSVVYLSKDKGLSWKKTADIKPLFWGKLFVHDSALYILGTRHEYGDVLIRRSLDDGKTWTVPDTPESGLLHTGRYHCAPCRIMLHKGRLWRSFELAEGRRPNWAALVISAPVDSDLLDAKNWKFSNPFKHTWSGSQWIEGNLAVTPQGKLLNILRTNGKGDDRAAITHVADDGMSLSHDLENDIINFPGGGVKFTIRYDEQTSRYWSIVSKQTNPKAYRNVLVLTSSTDLIRWQVKSPLLNYHHVKKYAWQYIDWQFDDDDIIFVSRTAFDDGLGGAQSAHNANYFTFHKITDFRHRKAGPLKDH